MTIMTFNKSKSSRSNHQCLPSPITLHLHLHPPHIYGGIIHQIKYSRLLIGKQILIFFPIRCRRSRILILLHQPVLQSSNNNICHVLPETSCFCQENIGGNQPARPCKLSGDYYRFSTLKGYRLWPIWLQAEC